MNQQFTHLQTQSEYSIENSTIRIKKLIKSVKELGMDSVALVDNNNIFGAIKFYRAATAENIKPIFGATLTLENDNKIILLCMNREGYLNLSKLISLSYKKDGKVFITKNELFELNENLILISSKKSPIAELLLSGKLQNAEDELKEFNDCFKDRHYLGITRTLRGDDEKHLHLALALGVKTKTPVVALNDTQFLKPEDFETHEARVCIASGGLVDDEKRIRLFSGEQYLKSPAEMAEIFDDIPAVLTNSVEIAKRCSVKFELDEKNYLPQFPIPDGLSVAEFFTSECEIGLGKIIKKHNLDSKEYHERLKFEIDTILEMDFPGYFLIVADFIKWSKDNEIPVGPGRGSGAGSLVAYSLGITGVDPLKYDLLFERFLNPDRVSMPDFDIDFAPHGRDKVIDYVARKYGRESVSQIITFGTMAAKGVVRDVGRVLGQGYGFTDSLAKLIPNDLDITIDKTLNYEENLKKKAEKDKKDFAKIKSSKEQELSESAELTKRYNREEAVTSIIDLAKELEGMSRNAGTHAGGVIIAPGNISDFCPTYKGLGADDVIVSQFDKNDVEAVGLVKFDFLGLSNLSVIQKTVKIIKEYNLAGDEDKSDIDIDEIDLEDDTVFELYRKGDTTGIFQMESRGMREYLTRLEPTSIHDIVAMNALYRPGAMDQVDNYIDVKHGRKVVEYLHPILEETLAPTNGVFVYQEQVMRAAQKLSGFTLGGADLLRRAMGKKKPEEMAEQRENFVSGAFELNQVEKELANEIFDYIDKFSGYGFNKSHSVAYALVSYQTAWLKTHYRSAFMSAVISGVMGDTDRVGVMVSEILDAKIKIIPPNINLSNYDFSLAENKEDIIYGLGAIKGVGEAFIEQIVLNRKKGYKNLFDFCNKIEKKYLNKRAIEALIHSGSFDIFNKSRATLLASYETAVKSAEISQKEKASGQGSLFGSTTNEVLESYITKPSQGFKQELTFEKAVLGFYFSAHPVDEFKDDLQVLHAKYPRDITLRGAKELRIVAMIEHIFYRETKKGQMATLVLTDGVKKQDVIMFNKTLLEYGEKIEVGKIVVASCMVMKNYSDDEKYKDHHRVSVNEIEDAEIVRSKYAKYFAISLQKQHQQKFKELKDLILKNSGTTPVVLNYKVDNIVGSTILNEKYNIKSSSDMEIKINNFLNSKSSKTIY
jgi:DNA polymerase-3 subunit alpha